MRKLILIAAMVLASATAQAEVGRNLAVAATDEPAAAEPAKPAEAPQYIERPPAVDTKPEPPKADPAKPAADATAPLRTDKPEKAKRRHRSIEARVIYELHRHGIYW
jgi:cell pole-organizing protein PopZ